MPISPKFDFVVVGAGIEGSSAAWQLAKTGNRTLLLEQFPLPHCRGSSHGQSRIIRKAYEQDYYVPMMDYAYNQYEDLEKQTNTKFFEKVGLLVFDDGSGTTVNNSMKSLAKYNVQHEVLAPQKFRQDFPMIGVSVLNALFEPGAGFLRADKALSAILKAFQSAGGVLCDGEKVVEVVPGSGQRPVQVITNRGRYSATKVILCLGAWAGARGGLLPALGVNLPLRVARINVCYWREKDATRAFPTTFIADSRLGHVYGIRSDEYPGLIKVCAHDGETITSPDERDKHNPTYDYDVNKVRRFLSSFFPHVDNSSPSVVERCMYTITPDHQPIIDVHPKFDSVIFAAGFSGHGFKLGPAVGRVLCDMAVGRPTKFPLAPFRLSRFGGTSGLRSKY